MASEIPRVLIIGYGNPGRLDDGLGPVFVEAIEKLQINQIHTESDYQLTVEDSALIAEHEIVVFVDASVAGREPFFFKKIEPKSEISFSTHSIDPENVLGLSKKLFNAATKGYVLGIRGYEFNEFGEYLSDKAQINLKSAVDFLQYVIQNNDFTEIIN